MITNKKNFIGALSLLLSVASNAGTAGEISDMLSFQRLKEDTSWLLHIGGFISSQGIRQHINLSGLVGNEYYPTQKHSGNVIVGTGFLLPGISNDTVGIEYGVQLYYLPKVTSAGSISIENVLPNLTYKYGVAFLPLYANAKLNIATKYDKTKVTMDFGIGPDFMTMTGYSERPLTTATIPNNFYSRQSQTQLSALFGVGIRSAQIPGGGALEVGYRLFYLGRGNFSPNNSQVLTNFDTGPIYANAVTLTMRV